MFGAAPKKLDPNFPDMMTKVVAICSIKPLFEMVIFNKSIYSIYLLVLMNFKYFNCTFQY